MKEKFDVGGMSCAACSANIEKKLAGQKAVSKVEVNLLRNSMVVEYNEKEMTTKDIENIVEGIGYSASLKDDIGKKEIVKNEINESEVIKKRIIFSLIFLVLLMYVSMGKMINLPMFGFLEGSNNAVSYALLQMLLTIPILIANKKFFVNGFRGLLKKVPNMDSLVAVSASASFIYGVFAIFRMSYGLGNGDISLVESYSGNLYFDSSAMILILISVGKYLEARSKGKTTQAISKLIDLTPKIAIIRKDGVEKSVKSEEINVGDIVIVKKGMTIPVDGKVISGKGYVDEAAITGESMPVSKTIDASVTGATILVGGYIEFEAVKVGNDTALSQIIKLVEEASSSKAPISKLADKIAAIFVPTIMALATVVWIIWMIAGYGFEFSLARGITVLIIACPCALGLATPAAIMVGTGKAASKGILFKSAESIEILGKTDKILFDKTGTLTEGKPKVIKAISYNEEEKNMLQIAYSLEQKSEHPLAVAINAFAKKNSADYTDVQNYKTVDGGGIKGQINSIDYFIGNSRFIEKNSSISTEVTNEIEKSSEDGQITLLLANKDEVIGIFVIEDQLKQNSIQTVGLLNNMGIDTLMITGDSQKTASIIAKRLGIENFQAEVLPQDKDKYVQEYKNNNEKVAMIGDGVNDSPALVRADVGIALASGTDISIESADVVILDDIKKVFTAVKLSRAVIRNIKQNLFWAFFYNLLCIPIAAGVFYPAFGIVLQPIIGAAAMSVSSLIVVSNALRLKKFSDGANFGETSDIDESSFDENINEKSKVIEEKETKMKEKTIKIEGMMCEHCQGRVDEALNKIEGVSAKVDLENNCAYVEVDEKVEDSTLIKSVEEAGYKVLEVK